jgi:serine/threonine protein kinase
MTQPSTIAHYRITSKPGEGGVGVVHRATDTKLNRDVAVRVLPPAFAQDSDRMARMEREAQVLASLNHPGIAAIYGVEERALIMELVPGPTLADCRRADTARRSSASRRSTHRRAGITPTSAVRPATRPSSPSNRGSTRPRGSAGRAREARDLALDRFAAMVKAASLHRSIRNLRDANGC